MCLLEIQIEILTKNYGFFYDIYIYTIQFLSFSVPSKINKFSFFLS